MSRLIGRIARAMAVGEEIDWDAVSRPGESLNSQQIRNLQRVDRLWRSAGTPQLADSSTASGSARDGWSATTRGLVALATIHVLLGVAGWFLAPTGALLPSIGAQMLAVPVFAATAAWLLLGGRRDARAASLGAFYLTCAAAFAHGPAIWAWAQLPAPIGNWPLPRALVPDAFLGLLIWGFARSFPRVVRLSATDAWMELGQRAAGAIGVALFAANFLVATLPASAPAWVLSLERAPSSLYWLFSLGISLPPLALMLLRAREAPEVERRRVALMSSALLVGLGPIGVTVMADLAVPGFHAFVNAPANTAWVIAVVFGFALTTPLSTAACIKSHNVLPVRFVFHAAARYFVLTTAITIGLVVPIASFALFLYEGRSRPLEELIGTARGRGLVLASSLAILLLFQRDKIFRWLRRFFLGKTHDWPALLSSSGRLLRHARTPRELEDTLARHMKGHAHFSEFFLLLRSRDGQSFEPVGLGEPLPRDSALVEIVFAGESPLTTLADAPDDIVGLLPAGDRDWLTRSGVGLIAPLIGQGGDRVGMIAFGSNAEGLPHTGDEREFAAALAGSVALALERNVTGGDDEPTFECPECLKTSVEGDGRCACGAQLQEAPLPRVLARRFQVEARIGRGGMGVVYRARDLSLGRTVALKTLPRVSREAAARLRAEARSMAELQHPNVAFILEFQSWRNVPVLVVEYLAGGTLRERLSQDWAWRDAAELGVVLCGALAAMHASGVSHRDVKPSNIGFAADGTPKLLDLGLARMASQAVDENGSPYRVVDSSSGSLSYLGGTPLYMSPEALMGGAPDPRYDLWSLAVVLYELAAGRHPFNDREAFTAALRRRQIPPIPALNGSGPNHPTAVTQFFDSALHADPERRPASALELAGMLEATIE